MCDMFMAHWTSGRAAFDPIAPPHGASAPTTTASQHRDATQGTIPSGVLSAESENVTNPTPSGTELHAANDSDHDVADHGHLSLFGFGADGDDDEDDVDDENDGVISSDDSSDDEAESNSNESETKAKTLRVSPHVSAKEQRLLQRSICVKSFPVDRVIAQDKVVFNVNNLYEYEEVAVEIGDGNNNNNNNNNSNNDDHDNDGEPQVDATERSAAATYQVKKFGRTAPVFDAANPATPSTTENAGADANADASAATCGRSDRSTAPPIKKTKLRLRPNGMKVRPDDYIDALEQTRTCQWVDTFRASYRVINVPTKHLLWMYECSTLMMVRDLGGNEIPVQFREDLRDTVCDVLQLSPDDYAFGAPRSLDNIEKKTLTDAAKTTEEKQESSDQVRSQKAATPHSIPRPDFFDNCDQDRPETGFFVRVDRVSLKDGVHGAGPYFSLSQMIESAVTGKPGHQAVEYTVEQQDLQGDIVRNDGDAQGANATEDSSLIAAETTDADTRSTNAADENAAAVKAAVGKKTHRPYAIVQQSRPKKPIKFYLFPWMTNLHWGREFRVFIFDGKVTGYSQQNLYTGHPLLSHLSAKNQRRVVAYWVALLRTEIEERIMPKLHDCCSALQNCTMDIVLLGPPLPKPNLDISESSPHHNNRLPADTNADIENADDVDSVKSDSKAVDSEEAESNNTSKKKNNTAPAVSSVPRREQRRMVSEELGHKLTPYFIEPNPFGVAYPAGSSLFHWVHDYDTLYGQSSESGLDFRFTAL